MVFNQEEFAKIRAKSEEIQRALIVEEDNEINRETEKKIEILEENKQSYKEIASNIQQEKETPEQNDIGTKGITSVQKEITINATESTQNEKEGEQRNSAEENVFKKFTFSLTPKEKEVVQTLLEKQDVENRIAQIAKSENEMLEFMISNINDKALETIGDTVIESDMSSIYEDYEEDIKQVL